MKEVVPTQGNRHSIAAEIRRVRECSDTFYSVTQKIPNRRTAQPSLLVGGMLLSVPAGVVLTILTEWVEGISLLQLDRAYCNRALRPAWLEILQSRGCILSSIPRNWVDKTRNSLYQFAVSKNVKVAALFTDGSDPLDLVHRVLLLSNQCITEVRMRSVSERLFPFISNVANCCTNIKILRLDSCELAQGFPMLLRRNPHLEKLTLRDCKDTRGQPLETFDCPNLSYLCVHGEKMVNNGWLSTILQGVRANLLSIELRTMYSKITEEVIHIISDTCPNLQRIVFGAQQIPGPAIVTLTEKCRHVRVLDIANTMFPPRGLQQILQNLLSINSIRFYFCGPITDDDIILLGRLHGGSLENISVEHYACAFSEDSLCTFLKHCKRLHTVRLNIAAEWEYSVKTIASLAHLPLTTLVLDAHLSREVKRGIMKYCPHVTVLGLRGENDGGAIVPIVRACKKLKKLYTVGLNAHWQQEMMAVNRHLAIENNYLFPPLVYLE